MRLAPRLAFGLTVLLWSFRGAQAAGALEALADLPDCGSQACIIETCSVKDGLEVARVEAAFCERPVRSRKTELLLPLIVEVPAWFAPWLRTYSRWRVVNEFAWDDWLMLVSGVLYTVFLALGHYTGVAFLGVDIWTLDEGVVTQGLKVFYVAESFYLALLCLTKVALICFYLRIFPSRRFHQAAYVALGLVIVPTAIMIIVQIVQCRPVNYAWDGWLIDGAPEEHCFNVNVLVYAAAVISIAQDVLVLTLPLPLLLKLRVEGSRRAGIVFMFSLGIFVLITACVRLRYVASFHHTANPTWDYTDPQIWSGVEVAVSMVVVCLPAVRALLHQAAAAATASAMARGSYNVKDGGASSAPTDGSGALGSGSRRKVSKVFGSKGGSALHKDNESEIELGLQFWGPKKSEVLTEVSGLASRESSLPEGSRQEDEIEGIRVKTTTTSRVDVGP